MREDEKGFEEAAPAALVPVPDLAGTPAADADGRFFGDVYGALAEEGSGLIRYLDVDVHGAGRHVLVPVGHVRVSRTGEKPAGIRLRAATAADLESLPAFRPQDPLRTEVPEEEILRAYGRLFAGEKYYAHPAYDHAGLYAGERQIVQRSAAEAEAALRPSTLAPLSQLRDFELAEDQPDIRGWALLTAGERLAGHVDDLLADPTALQVRYAVLRRADGADVLLPIGFLEIDRAGQAVRAPALRWDEVRALPPQRGPVTRSDEEAVRRALDGALSGPRRFQRPDFRISEAD